MWDKTKRAMDTMREKNRQYLEEQKKKDEAVRDKDPQPEPGEARIPEAPSCEDPSCGDPSFGDLTPDEKAAAFHEEEKLKLEKGDLPAMILSALMVFGPVFLVLGAIVALAWIFLH